jgi:hypothetical protein
MIKTPLLGPCWTTSNIYMRLTDAQIAEVQRRLNDSNRVLLSAEEARERLERLSCQSQRLAGK